MNRNRRLALSLLGLLCVVVVVYAFASREADAPAPVGESETEVVPTGENVDPAIHSQMMTLKKAADDAPDDPAPRLELARFLQDAHRSAEAAEAYELTLELNPAQRQPWLDLANAYGADSRWDEVVDASDRMLERFPDDASALYNLGAAHANSGRTSSARTAWQAVSQQDADAELKSQARESIARLDAGPAPTAVAQPLKPGAEAGPLPQGHPAIPPGTATSGAPLSGVQSRVVSGGTATTDASRARDLIKE